MSNDSRDLGWVAVRGGPRAMGQALGVAGRAAVHRHLLPAEIWQRVTDPAHAPRLARVTASVRDRFPAIWAEIEGLAAGLDLPVAQVMAWNCRGDLLASVPDGCTTVLLPGEVPVLAHNEDGLPFFRGACFIADAAPDGAPAFRSFCYPGSIPGHTFAFAETGLVQTVNNIRLTGVEPDMSRMVLGRAILAAPGIEDAIAILRAHPNSGGFHFALSHRTDPRLVSVEFGGGEVSVRTVTEASVHANHALHQPRGLARQIITRSSGDRQVRGEAMLASGERDPLTILRDTGGHGLPIRRDASDDPDDENTLATALFHIRPQGIEWSIHDRHHGAPAYESSSA